MAKGWVSAVVLAYGRVRAVKLHTFKKKRVPEGPGVYIFRDSRRRPLYIGRASSLRSRVRSYFSRDLIASRGPVLVDVVERASNLEWVRTDSVLEAIILEANLIKRYKPKGNTELKDDKSFNYIVITKEEYPRVLLVRGKDISGKNHPPYRHLFGPFPYGLQFKEALRLVRKIFPFRDACLPAQAGTPETGKPCFNAQIGLCPGVCTGTMGREEYARRVQEVKLFFEGKKKALTTAIKHDMKRFARRERFEEAEDAKRRLFALTHIQDVALIKDEFRSPGGTEHFRIEAYDIAHIAGAATVGVMTVVENGEPNKNEYRMFRIRAQTGGSDTDALKEVLSRRFGHDEWAYPKLIVIDGGKPQKHTAEKLLAQYGMGIPVVSVVKDDRHRPREILGKREYANTYAREIVLANSEAHRFAIQYHRRRMRGRLRNGHS